MDGLSPKSDTPSSFVMIHNNDTQIDESPQPPTHPNNPSTSSTMPCPHCNTINPSFFDSCTKCGNSLSSIATATTPNYENNDTQNPPEQPQEPLPPMSPPIPKSESQYQPEPPQYIISPRNVTIPPPATYPHQMQPPPYDPNFDNHNIAGNDTTCTQGQPQNPNPDPNGTAAVSETPGSWPSYSANQRAPELSHRYTQYDPNNAKAHHLNAPINNIYPTEEQLFGNFFIRTISNACSFIMVTLLSFHLWFTTSLHDEFQAAQTLSAMGMVNLYLCTSSIVNQT